MIECDQYAKFTYILLSNGKIEYRACFNNNKHKVIKLSLGKYINKIEAEFIRTSPASGYGGFAVFNDGCLHNMPSDFLSRWDYKESYQNKIIPVNEKNEQICITTACYAKEETKIIVGCGDGSLHIFTVVNDYM